MSRLVTRSKIVHVADYFGLGNSRPANTHGFKPNRTIHCRDLHLKPDGAIGLRRGSEVCERVGHVLRVPVRTNGVDGRHGGGACRDENAQQLQKSHRSSPCVETDGVRAADSTRRGKASHSEKPHA